MDIRTSNRACELAAAQASLESIGQTLSKELTRVAAGDGFLSLVEESFSQFVVLARRRDSLARLCERTGNTEFSMADPA